MKPDVLEDLARFEAGDVSIADLEGRHGADVVATASLHADLSKAATREITPPEWALVADRMMAAAMTAPVTEPTPKRPVVTSTPTTSDATPTERTKVGESPTDLTEVTRPTDRLTETTVVRDDHSDRTVDRATTTIAQRTETEPADRPVVTEPAPPDVARVRDREADSSR